MRKLYYASGFVILSDSVCDAVVEYAHQLAQAKQSDLVTVPALSDEGAVGKTTLLIGPASALFAAPALDRGVDLDDDESVAYMRKKISRLLPPRAASDQPDEAQQADFDM
jgi:hypothetical protein